MESDTLTVSLRLGGAVMVSWLFWRVLFDSWNVTEQPAQVRRIGWVYFRLSVAIVCGIFFLAMTENVLRADQAISRAASFWIESTIAIAAMVWAAAVHHALDKVTGHNGAVLRCVAIGAIFTIYAIARAT